MEQPIDGRISHTINKLITSLYLLTPKTVQQPTRNGESSGVRLSSSELEDLSQSKLWKGSSEWSNEVQEIRSELVHGRKQLSHSEICLRLKTLKLVDKKIKEIDDGLLKFTNVKELTLTGNLIKHIHPNHLPKQLEVLECCYNELSDIDDLVMSPPASLVHLGLSHNSLRHVKFPHDKWSGLVSLDLSNNQLSDLGLIMRTLVSLASLRNLLLMGNPLALATAYRAFVIDKLRDLTILDDMAITSDERKSAHGVAKKARDTAFISTAELKIQINEFADLPQIQLTEETAESPQLTRYYLIASYGFMPVSETQSTSSASNDNDGKETINNSQSSSTSEVQFAPVPYHTRNECNFSKTHNVSDLTSFQRWLSEGLTVRVFLQKATFVKDDQTTTASSRPTSTRPSSSKKTEKKVSKKKLSQLEEPPEQWTCAERANTCIGTSNVSMAAFLDGNSKLSDHITMSITDSAVCSQFQSDVKGATTDDSITEVQWNMKCSCVLRKIQTVGDLKLLNS